MGAGRRRDSAESYSPQSSSAPGASARASGFVSVTSSSAPQSGHDTISPFTASTPTVTSASHSGHLDTDPLPPMRQEQRKRYSAPDAPSRRNRERALSPYMRSSAAAMPSASVRPSSG